MKRKKKPSSLNRITLIVAAAMLLCWIVTMFCATSFTAELATDRYLEKYGDQATRLSGRHLDGRWGRDLPTENFDEHCMWDTVNEGNINNNFYFIQNITRRDAYDGMLKRREIKQKAQAATAIFDSKGNIIECSWEDFLYFGYMSREEWADGEEHIEGFARAYLDRKLLPESVQELGYWNPMFPSPTRFTGVLNGAELILQKMEMIDWAEYMQAARADQSGRVYTNAELERKHDLKWTTVYEDPDAVPTGEETVTLYANDFDVNLAQDIPKFWNGRDFGKRYKIEEYVEAMGTWLLPEENTVVQSQNKYFDLIIPSVNYCVERDEGLEFTEYSSNAPQQKLQFFTVSAVLCHPWLTAMSELIYVYIVTFLIAAALVLIIRRILKRWLISPLLVINDAFENDRSAAYLIGQRYMEWPEIKELYGHYTAAQDKQKKAQNELTRLNTALDYAKEAEEDRRRMTSNIAHELKTPLAVIHSYAEGLKERIAEDKREKYLDVILAEAEHTDAMVLEMLDLSRLEAGRVKLARDDFSLTELTKTVFGRLERLARAKELNITFEMPENCIITADESRMVQVVENLAGNAVKYTPVGGNIRVKITPERNGTVFAIENDSKPFSAEEIDKIWDAFFRVDESRSGGGTGLGLTIAKSIVELHGGSCAVQNTETGVKFSFAI